MDLNFSIYLSAKNRVDLRKYRILVGHWLTTQKLNGLINLLIPRRISNAIDNINSSPLAIIVIWNWENNPLSLWSLGLPVIGVKQNPFQPFSLFANGGSVLGPERTLSVYKCLTIESCAMDQKKTHVWSILIYRASSGRCCCYCC